MNTILSQLRHQVRKPSPGYSMQKAGRYCFFAIPDPLSLHIYKTKKVGLIVFPFGVFSENMPFIRNNR